MNNMMQQFQQFKQNPVGWLMNRGVQVPQNITNDPNAIIQHLMNTGQVNQDMYNQARQIASQFQDQFRG